MLSFLSFEKGCYPSKLLSNHPLARLLKAAYSSRVSLC